jgi:hypothetical protein
VVLLAGTGLASAAAFGRSAQTLATPIGYTPAQLQSAYDLQSAASGMRQVVAVVNPYDDPTAESDLGAYRTQFGLPPCTTANGCFSKVNEQGNATPLPDANLNWALSISTALDMISATCPDCRLLLVETDSPAITDVGTGVNTAIDLHATAITTGVTQPETSADTGYDSEYFNHPGVAITAPAGDVGYGSIFYPAASPYVTAVGGTTLTSCTTALRGWCEAAWADTSSGCSAYEPQPSWQATAVADTGCTTRVVADTAADADPSTGVAVYDTYETTSQGWQPGPDGDGEGGTAVAAAIIAGVYALAGTPALSTYPVSYLYQYPGSSAPAAAYPNGEGLNDITTGPLGTCTPAPLCNAGTGYDAPTGLGSPAFTTSFSGTGSQSGSVYSGVAGKCLDNAGGVAADYNKVDISACNTDTAEQDWTIEADGTVQIDGDCLDVYHSGTANLTPVDLYACDSGGSQEWRPEANGDLVNPESGKCLADPSASTTNGTQLEIYTCNGTGDEWILPYTTPTTTGPITSQLSASMCVDDYHSGTSSGNTIDLYACNGGDAQDWVIEPGGTLQVFGRCMATAADGVTDGTAVQLYGCTGDPNQQWIARPDGSLVNRRSGTCLDDPGASLTSGTALVISSCNESAEQSWTLPTPADSLTLTLLYLWPPLPSPPVHELAQVTLTCDPTGGTHPDAQNACDDLTAADGDISSIPAVTCPTPPTGFLPATATATGTWGGVPDNFTESFVSPWCINDDTGGNVFSFVQF